MSTGSVSLNLPSAYYQVSSQQRDIRLTDDGRNSLVTHFGGRQVSTLGRQESRLGVFNQFRGALQRSLGEVVTNFAKRPTAKLDADTIKMQNKRLDVLVKSAYADIERQVASNLGVSTSHKPPTEALDHALDGATLQRTITGYRQALELVQAQVKEDLPQMSAEHASAKPGVVGEAGRGSVPVAPPRTHRNVKGTSAAQAKEPVAPPRPRRDLKRAASLPNEGTPVAPPRIHRNVARPQTPQS